MAEVNLEIAGRSYMLTCRDGEEDHLIKLGKLVDAKAKDAGRAIGNMTENRHLLVTALLLADSLSEDQKRAPAPDAASADDTEACRRDRATGRTDGKALGDA